MLCTPSSFSEEILTASILLFHFLKVFVCWQISDWFQAARESYFTGWLELLWNMTLSQLTPPSCGTGAGHAAGERDRQQVSSPPPPSSSPSGPRAGVRSVIAAATAGFSHLLSMLLSCLVPVWGWTGQTLADWLTEEDTVTVRTCLKATILHSDTQHT